MINRYSRIKIAPTAVSPDFALVRNLTSHHRKLVEIYQQIHDAVTDDRFDVVGLHAKEFHDRLHLHVQTENLGFYLKLNQQLQKTGSRRRKKLLELQRQMWSVGARTLDFMWKARRMELTPENSGRFLTDLEQVGSMLVARIRKEEEELYPLYLSLIR